MEDKHPQAAAAGQPISPHPRLPKQRSVVGKFLKDVVRYLFNSQSAGEAVKRDIGDIEQQRAKAKAAAAAARERLALLVGQKKLAEAAEAQKRLIAVKRQEADRFRKEREKLVRRQEEAARHLLQSKKERPDYLIKTGLAKPFQGTVAPAGVPLKTEAPVALEKNKERAALRFKEERLKHETGRLKDDIENRPWQSYDVVRTNLVKEQRSLFFNWQSKILALVLSMAVAALLSLLAYGFLLVWEKDKMNSNQYIFDNLESINIRIRSEEAMVDEVLRFNDRLLFVDYILDNHLYWTNLFKFLENNTIANVYYENFRGDLSGQYQLPAVAKDYHSIYLQLKILQQAPEQVTSVDTGAAEAAKTAASATGSGDSAATPLSERIKFNLNLILNRSIFLKK